MAAATSAYSCLAGLGLIGLLADTEKQRSADQKNKETESGQSLSADCRRKYAAPKAAMPSPLTDRASLNVNYD